MMTQKSLLILSFHAASMLIQVTGFFEIIMKQFNDSFTIIKSTINYTTHRYISLQMAHVDAHDSYNMILGETSGNIQSSFLDDTVCTETEKVSFIFF